MLHFALCFASVFHVPIHLIRFFIFIISEFFFLHMSTSCEKAIVEIEQGIMNNRFLWTFAIKS